MRRAQAETVPVYKTVAEEVLELTDTAELRVSVTSKAGEPPYIDFRIWVDNENYSGPTKKGFSIPTSDISELKKIITKLEKQVK